jgi:hypothetical protein
MKIKNLLPLAALLTAACLSSCRTYHHTSAGGRFHGEPRMVPVTPNTFFFYRPKDKDDVLFSFEPGEQSRFRGRFAGNKITPDAMLTTGASVPRSLWKIPGLSPFDYTRAALIHDWLFEAKHRHDIGRWLQQNGVTDVAKAKGVRLEREYDEYGSLKQDDAADIYAESIRAIMDLGTEMKADLDKLIERNENPMAKTRLEELGESLKPARKNSFWLWAHRWFTSEGCLVPTARKTWESQHDDLGLYELLARSDVAVEKGYMSKWLQKKFRAVYQAPKGDSLPGDGKLAGVDAAVKAGTDVLLQKEQSNDLPPRIYLEVEDAASQAILLRHAERFPHIAMKRDENFSTLGENVLLVYYYASKDKSMAEVLQTLAGMLPDGKLPATAQAVKLSDGGLYRPKHFDLHISKDVAARLTP